MPHLPFAAWGFRHPPGALLLDGGDPTSIDLECERLGDRGDPLHMLRPKEARAHPCIPIMFHLSPSPGSSPTLKADAPRWPSACDPGLTIALALVPLQGKLINWASCHDMSQYETDLSMLAQACTKQRRKARTRLQNLAGFGP